MTIDKHGSFISEGPRYSVLQCRGPVRYRQTLASDRGVICYAEAHLNASSNPKAQHGFVIAGSTTPKSTEEWADAYLSRIAETFGVKTYGVKKGIRGSGNVHWVKWPTPTMLLEPLFVSDPIMAARITSGEGLDALGRCLAGSIRATFPDGGLVGLSIGHAYRGTGDGGANVARMDIDGDGEVDEPDPAFDQEAELCEAYVDAATEILTEIK